MIPIKDFDKIETRRSIDFPPVGGYVAIIKNVRDVQEKKYLECLIDIAEGEFKDFYQKEYEFSTKWRLRGFISYNQDYEWALKNFKGFTTSVEHSNPGYTWDWDEKKLKGKKVGIITREEEYLRDDGNVGISYKIFTFRSIDEIRKGNFKVPPRKTLTQDKPQATIPARTSSFDLSALDDLQF